MPLALIREAPEYSSMQGDVLSFGPSVRCRDVSLNSRFLPLLVLPPYLWRSQSSGCSGAPLSLEVLASFHAGMKECETKRWAKRW